MFQSLFEDRGRWYKGNLHMHTTRSDGQRSPREAVEEYRRHGYDFVAVTDHRKPSRTIEPGQCGPVGEEGGDIVSAGSMLLLAGVEWDNGGANTDRPDDVPTYHILGIGMKENRGIDYSRTPHPAPQAIADAIRADGGLVILAHPAWSVMDPGGILNLKGLTAAEIYNSVSDLPFNGRRADSSAWFDIWATSYGRLVPAVASDDAHAYEGDQCVAATMVNAVALTSETVKDALRAGNFYATQRPVIHELALDREKGTVHLECSEDVTTAVFLSNAIWTPERVTVMKNGKTDYRITSEESYLRAELITWDGRRAWTSPFAVK